MDKLVLVQDLFSRFKALWNVFITMEPGSQAWEDVIMNDVAYFAESLKLGVDSVKDGVEAGAGTKQDCWDVLDIGDLRVLLGFMAEIGVDQATIDNFVGGITNSIDTYSGSDEQALAQV